MNKILGFIKYAILSALGQGIGLLLPLAVAYLLSPETFASFSLSLMVVLFFLALLSNPTQTPTVVYGAQEYKSGSKINRTFSALISTTAVSFIVVLILIKIFEDQLLHFIQTEEVLLTSALYFSFVGMSLKTIVIGSYLAIGEKNKSALVELIFNCSNILAVGFLVYLNLLSLANIFFSHVVGGIITLILFIFTTNKKIYTPFEIHIHDFKRFLRFSAWQIFGLTSVFLVNWGDNLVLRYFSSMKEVGVYNLAYQIFKASIMATYIVYNFLISDIVQQIKNTQFIDKLLGPTRRYALITAVIATSCFFLASYYFLPQLYGENYLGSVPVLGVLLISTIFSLMSIFYIAICNAMEKYKFTQAILVAQMLSNLVLNVLLVPKFGIVGAAIATSITYVCVYIGYEIYFRKKLRPLLNS